MTVAIVALAIFAAGAGAGAVAGVVLVVSLGIRQEERKLRQQQDRYLAGTGPQPRLPEAAPGRLSAGARRLTGLHVRRIPVARPSRQDHDLLV
jgi:hypothetical protein